MDMMEVIRGHVILLLGTTLGAAVGTVMFALGFTVMMALDVALG